MSLSIRPAAASDIAAITAIYRDSVLNGIGTYELDPPDEAEMARRFANVTADGFPWLVAEDERGEVLGYAYASPFRTRPAYDWLCEDSIYVSPEARGRSIGADLLAALLERVTAAGYRQMVAVIGGANPASIALHEKAGFSHAGTMKSTGFKMGRWLDTVIMQKPLGEGDATLPASRPAGR